VFCHHGLIARLPALAGSTKSSTMAFGSWSAVTLQGVRLITRNGHDWSDRFPLIAEAAAKLRARSFLVDGEAVACDRDGLPSFDRLRYRRGDGEPSFCSPSTCWNSMATTCGGNRWRCAKPRSRPS
jgi:hypothetical protein